MGKKTILIVEDDESIVEFLKIILQQEDFAYEVAMNGEIASQIIQTKPIDLILLDLLLPKKSGQELIEYIQEKGLKIPVIIITGQDIDEKYRKSLLAASIVKDFIIKPVRQAYLVYKIHQILGTKPKEIEALKEKKIEIERFE